MDRLAWSFQIVLLGLLLFVRTADSVAGSLTIGALFEKEHEGQLRALEWAVEEVNLDPQLLPGLLILVMKNDVPRQDSFTAQKRFCRMSEKGIAAMFGPMSPLTASHVESMCTAFEIPHMQWQWDARDSKDYFSISLYPHYLTLSQAYRDAILYWGWEKFTIFYETNDGLTRLQEVLKVREYTPAEITVRKLDVASTDYVRLLKGLRDNRETRFVIDCELETVKNFLHAALKVRMISDSFHYFFTNLDLGLLDLSDYQYGGSNITAFRLIDPDRDQVVAVRSSWHHRTTKGEASPLMQYTQIAGMNIENGTHGILTETALAYDAFHLFAKGLQNFDPATNYVDTVPQPCDKYHPWRHGYSLINYMKSTKFEGLSGTIQFDDKVRKDFNLDLIYLTQQGIQKRGTWDRLNGINHSAVIEEDSPNMHKYIVATYIAPPYVVESDTAPKGYTGFCVELLDLIAEKLNFTYDFLITDTVGKKQENKSWNGVMGALIENRADIGIGDLTISLVREREVDFTKPFLSLGITILFKKPEPKSLNLFSFLSPLSADVWVYMIAAYLCVSFMLFVIARFSPYEWCNPHPCNPDTDEVENQFTVMNSLWFTIGSLMQQGCEIAPRALSTRMVAGMWWFFTLIMISSYTANLAAFLTVERMESDIKGADDLAKQTEIKYGTFPGGTTQEFFEKNRFPIYQQMWTFMESFGPSVFPRNLNTAIEMVKKGKYAYITESTTAEFVVQRNCELMTIGGRLDSKGYGFATPPGKKIREHLTEVILDLTEKQVIEELKRKWWGKELGGGKCLQQAADVAGKAQELGVENVGGVFVVLIGGVVCGFFMALCEFMWKARKNAKKDKQTLCSEMSEEFRFAVRCFNSKKNKKKPEEEITDNGLQFMPLTGGYSQNAHGKEVYA